LLFVQNLPKVENFREVGFGAMAMPTSLQHLAIRLGYGNVGDERRAVE